MPPSIQLRRYLLVIISAFNIQNCTTESAARVTTEILVRPILQEAIWPQPSAPKKHISPSNPNARYCQPTENAACLIGKWRSNLSIRQGYLEALVPNFVFTNQESPIEFWVADDAFSEEASKPRPYRGYIVKKSSFEAKVFLFDSMREKSSHSYLKFSGSLNDTKHSWLGDYQQNSPPDAGVFSLSME